MSQFDAIVIGTGQAGPTLASRLVAAGRKTAVVERSRYGGTCVNYGCTPTKAMVASAKAAHVARRAADFGVVVAGDVSVNMPKVRARKDAIVAKSNQGIEKGLKGLDNLTVYEGHARFTGTHEVQVGDDRLQAKEIFINTGTRPFIPPIEGLDSVPYMTNSDIIDLDFVPPHLVVVGGSYIGLEFGQMFRRFGSRVTIVEKSDRLISHEDEDVSAAVKDILEDEGIDVRVDAACIKVAADGDGVKMRLDCDDDNEVTGTHLLVAVGRTPNTDDLGVEAAGLEVDDRGYIVVDDELRTNVEGVYALGDVNRRGAFTHTSYNDHEIVADNLLAGGNRRVSDRIVTYSLFIDPPLGRIGMTEREVRESGRRALVAKREMTKVSRAVEKGETRGFMKALVDAETDEILGAVILGTDGDEAIHSITDTMYAGAPYTNIVRGVRVHPTVSELIPTLLGSLQPLK